MQTPQQNTHNQTTKFLEVIDQIKNTNRLLKAEPKTYTAIAELISPTDLTIFSKLKSGLRKRVPLDVLANLAQHFKIDMNYIFYDGYQMNYYPEILKESSSDKTLDFQASEEGLRIINKNDYNALSLAIDLYKRLSKLVDESVKTSDNQEVTNK